METIHLNREFSFYACESFILELKAATKKYDGVKVHPYRAKCKYQVIKDPFANITLTQDSYVLGACSIEKERLESRENIIKTEHCFYMIAPKTLVESYIKQGGYIITPGWLQHWEHYVKKHWGFDEKSAKVFFKESCKRLILLDTGIVPNIEQKLKDFSHYVDTPYEVVNIGLDYFQLFIDNIITTREAKEREKITEQKLEKSRKSVADYALAFNLLSQLDAKRQEGELILQIKDIFMMLFAPQDIRYFSIRKDKLVDSLSDEVGDLPLTDFLNSSDTYEINSDGFSIKLLYNNTICGIVYTHNITLKQYIPQYLNLAININSLCALAINNTRKALKAKELEAQLTQQSKLAAMGEMMGSIAHQWRQPLNEININIEMLEEYYELDEIDEEFIEEFIEKNTKTIQFLSKTISDFSDFFRINKQKVYFSIKTCINNTINLILARLKKYSITLNIYGEDLTLFGLSNELQQVILNILNNAIDAMVENSIKDAEIKIEIREDNKQAIIVISDNAGGIPTEIIDRVFEPYFTTKEQGKGIGMGLYISKMIIEDNLNGQLSVKNHNAGAEFIIKLKKDAK